MLWKYECKAGPILDIVMDPKGEMIACSSNDQVMTLSLQSGQLKNKNRALFDVLQNPEPDAPFPRRVFAWLKEVSQFMFVGCLFFRFFFFLFDGAQI